MNTKNVIRILVLAALLAWPAVESYRLHVANQQLEASTQLNRRVTERIEAAHRQNVQVAKKTESPSVARP